MAKVQLTHLMKEKFPWIFTCTALEIITAIGITSYLLYLGDFFLGVISTLVFAKLIVFHFVMEYFDKKSQCNNTITP